MICPKCGIFMDKIVHTHYPPDGDYDKDKKIKIYWLCIKCGRECAVV